MDRRPNVVFLFADQHRAQSTGYAGDAGVRTPNMDRLMAEGVCFENAVSNHPTCAPFRASLLTGQYSQTHGVILNDASLNTGATTLGEAYAAGGYNTAYIGKWHLEGHGRAAPIPPERRRGFAYWKVLECTHDYNHSLYYDNDRTAPSVWAGYDSLAQTQDALAYMRRAAGQAEPFCLVVSWGPPHNPYGTAPQRFRDENPEAAVALRANVPFEYRAGARRDLAGYNAHIAALDECLGRVMTELEALGIAEDTILVYTSDHGDMLGSQGVQGKQKPWDESIRVPFLLRWPGLPAACPAAVQTPLGSPDIMPTLLELCGLPVPGTVEGQSFAPLLTGAGSTDREGVLIQCIHPFGAWHRNAGGREYRGVRTEEYTYVRDLHGPWLLYHNRQDPCQLENLVGRPEHAAAQQRLDRLLDGLLAERGDAFLPGQHYLDKWGYKVDMVGTLPYT